LKKIVENTKDRMLNSEEVDFIQKILGSIAIINQKYELVVLNILKN
jgi:hypothetical protein